MNIFEQSVLLKEGTDFFTKGKLTEALNCFLRLAAADPERLGAQLMIGLTRIKMGAPAQALINFSLAEDLLTHEQLLDAKNAAELKLGLLTAKIFCCRDLRDYERAKKLKDKYREELQRQRGAKEDL